MLLSLNELFDNISETGAVKYPNWFIDAKRFFHEFYLKVYTKPEDREILSKSRRMKVLFKYWGIKKVRTLDEAIRSIPLCRYCHKELALPRSTEPKDINDEWITVCRCTECTKKYVVDQTANSVERIYGKRNISSTPEMRIAKSRIQRANHLDHGDEITAKREKTCLDRYGVTNISKLINIKEAKEATTNEHYGVINPQFDSNINVERCKNSLFRNNRGYPVSIFDKTFYFLDPDEEDFVKLLCKYVNYNTIMTNSTPVEYHMNGRSYCYTPDINIANIFYVECKSSSTFSLDKDNIEYLLERIDIMTHIMKPYQRYILLVRPRADKHLYMSLNPNGSYILATESNVTYDLTRYFGDEIVYKASGIRYDYKNLDLRLIGSFSKSANFNTDIFNMEAIQKDIFPLYK